MKFTGLGALNEGNVMSLVRAAQERRNYPVRCLSGFGQGKVEHFDENLTTPSMLVPCRLQWSKRVTRIPCGSSRHISGLLVIGPLSDNAISANNSIR